MAAQPLALSLREKELEEQLQEWQSAVLCGFNQLLDLKDIGTGLHSTRLAEWATRVATQMGMDPEVARDAEAAALVHDIGKIGVPDSILNKNGPLTAEERTVINKHPEYGWAILRNFHGLERTSLFVLHHHENIDGSGYPAGLRGEEIPLGARIVAVIDAFDAMTSKRPYRDGLPLVEALRRLREAAGTQFDPGVVACFGGIAGAERMAVEMATGPRSAHRPSLVTGRRGRAAGRETDHGQPATRVCRPHGHLPHGESSRVSNK